MSLARDIDYRALVQVFLAESEDGFRTMEQGLVTLESRPADQETLQEIFRVVHTLKGNSAALEFAKVAECAHDLEELLDRLRRGKLPVTKPLVTVLLHSVDVLRQMVRDGAAGTAGAPSAHRGLLKKLGRFLKPSPTPSSHPEPEVVEEAVSARRPDARERPHDAAGERKTLRVAVEKLDKMLNLTGEIAIARGRLGQALEGLGPAAREALEAHHEVDRLYMELQEEVMRARMVPVGPAFKQQIRTVRDVATARGKHVRLVLEGGDVEVDTRVIEHLRDPLTHMIRNAVDHGIEPPEMRRGAGKDPCGRIILSASHDAGSIVIRVIDDGGGFDRKRIVERARSLGTLAEPEKLPDPELLRLVLEPGFSTAEAVTGVSGRGVGMDVVRKNIEALRGSLSIESREGCGTTLTIRLPLTLAIIAGFGVGVGEDTFVIPMEAVVECVELPALERAGAGGPGVINLRGQPLPYLRLRDVFGMDGAAAPTRENVVVVQHEARRAGLAVDALHGESQTVIKPLGRLFQGLPGVSGSAIMGNGRVALILDVPGILREAQATSAREVA